MMAEIDVAEGEIADQMEQDLEQQGEVGILFSII